VAFDSIPASTEHLPLRRIRFWQHGRAVSQMVRAYPLGVDALVDRIHALGCFTRFLVQRLLVPLYFAREQGWVIAGERSEMAAIMYLRREQRQGIRVMHVDDINVDARYRQRGLARRLMQFAEELARREERPFLKLAVTVANTPAVRLYRSLGYQEQRSHYFTCTSAQFPPRPPAPDRLALQPLRRRQATATLQRVYEMELMASAPALAPMLATYYPLSVMREAGRMYAIEQDGQLIGYGDCYYRAARWNVDLGLRPALWGTAQERQVIHRLMGALEDVRYAPGSGIALHLPSAAHFNALRAGTQSLAGEMGFVEQRYDRMIMAKVVAQSSR
jgi:GNAT superfamily N-acetyltransferase